MTEEAIVVVQKCTNSHETAYAVVGVLFDDDHMGTKVLDHTHRCLWPGCKSEGSVSAAIYKSEIRHV